MSLMYCNKCNRNVDTDFEEFHDGENMCMVCFLNKEEINLPEIYE